MLIVLDSVGCGELPDASAYGDQGSNTLGNIAREVRLRIPHLRSLGLGRVVDLGKSHDRDRPSAYGRMAESSAGKDSVTGHWEMMGIVLDRPFPTFPDGFPIHLVKQFERAIETQTLGNRAASGTQIIADLGEMHVETGLPILYTSADSVFQIACHENVVSIEKLYEWCDVARELCIAPNDIERIIARPFIGEPGEGFTRTGKRRDFVLPALRRWPGSS